MNSKLCKQLNIEFPLFAFSHCRDVVAAVTNAGGIGVFGAVNYLPEELDRELSWIDDQVGDRPYGVDLIVPNKFEGKGESFSDDDLLEMVPAEHKAFAASILERYGIAADDLEQDRNRHLFFRKNLSDEGARESLAVAFSHPVKLIANALGVPPQPMLEMGKEHGVAVAALVGARDHAIKQAQAGVDIVVAVGTEAGGHCGEVSTMVLVPEVVEAVSEFSDVSVLAAGGIATGSQMAASMAMGADGVWCGSVWLTTAEAETNPVVKQKMLDAGSRDTVRSRSRTGKPSRQLRSPWTDAWEEENGPEPLPMPLQTLLAEPALHKLDRLAQSGNQAAGDLATYWVGQAVGLMNQEGSVAGVFQDFKEDFVAAYERLQRAIEG